ncbi:putative mitochondrial carrier domain superfamily [Helianthus anomalus]
MWHALGTICRDEGVFGLYKGLGATLLVILSHYTTVFECFTYDRIDSSCVLF